MNKTGRLVVVDGGWGNSGFAAEVIASVSEQLAPSSLKSAPKRVTLPPAPAPASSVLEEIYYTKTSDVVEAVKAVLT